jgi:leucyl-tRNA synthetase
MFTIPVKPVIVPVNAKPAVVEAVKNGAEAWTEEGVMLPHVSPVGKELEITGLSNTEAGDRITSWLRRHGMGTRVVNYKLRDWLFSRQRYWGEPIPIVHWEDGTTTSLSDAELPLVLPQVADYKPSESGESPLAKATDWLHVVDTKTGKRGRRETNTMPQWAGSCWYYLRFIDPHNTEVGWDANLEKKWMPVDLYVGGAEHAVLHLLYSRFWHKVLYDLGYVSTKEPFQKLFNQGMVQSFAFKDSRGALVPSDLAVEDGAGGWKNSKTGESLERIVAKMSKSLKNVVTTDEVIEKYGADTLRTYLMFMGPLDTGRPWDPKAISGNVRFLRRAYSFVVGTGDVGHRDVVPVEQESMEVKRAVHKAVKKVGDDIEALAFNTPISTMMELLNTIGDKPVSLDTLEKFTLILSPFAPHLAEELWERLGKGASTSFAQWPEYNPAYVVDDVVTVVIQIAGKKRATVEVPPTITEEALKQRVVEAMSTTAYDVKISDRFITVYNPGTSVPRLVNVILIGS